MKSNSSLYNIKPKVKSDVKKYLDNIKKAKNNPDSSYKISISLTFEKEGQAKASQDEMVFFSNLKELNLYELSVSKSTELQVSESAIFNIELYKKPNNTHNTLNLLIVLEILSLDYLLNNLDKFFNINPRASENAVKNMRNEFIRLNERVAVSLLKLM